MEAKKKENLDSPLLAKAAATPLTVVEEDTTARVRAVAEAFLGEDSDKILRRAEAGARLRDRVRAHMRNGQLKVTITDNSYTMISVRRADKRKSNYQVRVHHMFCDAPSAIMRALARYIEDNDAEASRVLGDFIDDNQGRVTSKGKSRTLRMEPQGDVHDLQDIYDELNRCYFGGAVSAKITWGTRCQRRRRRNSIKMGSYSPRERLIRIHRSLDRSFVPRYFVAWVVYHEMLHQMHPIRIANGRRQVHPPAFLADEKKFAHYKLAKAWQDDNLEYLLHY